MTVEYILNVLLSGKYRIFQCLAADGRKFFLIKGTEERSNTRITITPDSKIVSLLRIRSHPNGYPGRGRSKTTHDPRLVEAIKAYLVAKTMEGVIDATDFNEF